MIRRISKTVLFLALAILFLLAFRRSGDGMLVFSGVAEALRNGTGWGRAMLAGHWEYPPLPSLVLLLLDYPARCLRLDAVALYVALSQACVVWQFAMLCGWRRCWFVLLPLLLPRVLLNMSALDAGWLGAALFAAGFCAFVRWQGSRSLREVVLAGAAFGLMALCGILPGLLGLAGTLCFWNAARPGQGLRTLLWSVWIYCILLVLLWNWLVIGNPLYCVFGALRQFSEFRLSIFASKFDSLERGFVFALLFPVAPLCIYSGKSDLKSASRYLLLCVVALLLYLPFCLSVSAQPICGSAFYVTILLALCTLAARAGFSNSVSRNAAWAAVCLGLAYSFIMGRALPGCSVWPHPAAQEITDFIDGFWPESRTMLYGPVVPAMYSDGSEKRFIARLDYSQEELLEYGEQEQMHLLLPPPESGLLPKGGELEDIFNQGRPWLFLEKKWDSGWRLWRVIRLQQE